jgi:Holliday junction resolvase-like predicted endonuclease
MKNNRMHNKEIGRKGEDIATEFLISKGYKVIQRNFSIRYGELDIVAIKEDELFFVEVKTSLVSREIRNDEIRPEENVHPGKKRSLAYTIENYLAKNFDEAPDWKFIVVTVKLCPETREARVKIIEDVL